MLGLLRLFEKCMAPWWTRRINVKQLVSDFQSSSPRRRDRAFDDIYGRGPGSAYERRVTPDDALLLLRIASTNVAYADGLDGYPDSRDSLKEQLINAVRPHGDARVIEAVDKYYELYDEEGRVAALNLLATRPEHAASVSYLDLISRFGWPGVPWYRVHLIGVGAATGDPRFGNLYFPSLFKMASGTQFEAPVVEMLLEYVKAGEVSVDQGKEMLTGIMGAFRKPWQVLTRARREARQGWMQRERYLEARRDVEAFVELIGRLDDAAARAATERALAFPDPMVKLAAISAQLLAGRSVPAERFVEVASSAEARNRLYQRLEELEQKHLFPSEFATHAAFAESAMVDWLTFGTELGRAPDEIELGELISVDAGEPHGMVDFYVYKFRTLGNYWASEHGWMPGVVGPVVRADQPRPDNLGQAFSQFEAWDSQSPEEHVGEVTDYLTELLERQRLP